MQGAGGGECAFAVFCIRLLASMHRRENVRRVVDGNYRSPVRIGWAKFMRSDFTNGGIFFVRRIKGYGRVGSSGGIEWRVGQKKDESLPKYR